MSIEQDRVFEQILHSIKQAQIPGNDWRRELKLIESTCRAALQSQVESAKHKPISVEERLPENSVDRFKGLAAYTDTVIAYTEHGTFIAAFDAERSEFYAGRSEFYNDRYPLDDVTHWLPIPRLTQ